ncbi:MAG: TrkH family potassium uptake protein [candidate division KSB1 bacterium]|nr:TrkH family potassium uptake protein [candidate division KSB1 bacterium]MDZ7318959.1 TrkH family potassium uptake protein [candidate division KSB1 bacterium]MDZ7341372.1 TrkH family potassium uptake protein [candidate division KSB1 bacterium]
MILIGTMLLMLPQSARHAPVSFVDALFTATSATCVTGLTVLDTGKTYSILGQLVILTLIQLGGLGIMTFTTFFIFLVMGKFSLSDRDVIQETITQAPFRNLAGLLKIVFLATMLIELVGAGLLTICFSHRFAQVEAIYYGVFHAVSAFCNAGFSLFPNNLMDYRGDWAVNIIVMALIIAGGIGFMVLFELKQYLTSRQSSLRKTLSFHSKFALLLTAILIAGGAIMLFGLEFKNVLLGQSISVQILVPIFQSVTSRTAGFNTVDIGQLTDSSLSIIILLMFIGASPGSCGGGIKTTTAGVVFGMLLSRLENRPWVNVSHHRIPYETVSRAISIAFFSLVVIAIATILLMTIEKGWTPHSLTRGMFLESLFEVVSAFGTVGLSTGITSGLSNMGKVVLIFVMFIGRVGPLTVVLAIAKKEQQRIKYAQVNVLVG